MQQSFNIKIATNSDIEGCSEVDRQMGFVTKKLVFKEAVKNKQVIIAKAKDKVIGYLRYGYLWEYKLPYIQVIRVLESFREF